MTMAWEHPFPIGMTATPWLGSIELSVCENSVRVEPCGEYGDRPVRLVMVDVCVERTTVVDLLRQLVNVRGAVPESAERAALGGAALVRFEEPADVRPGQVAWSVTERLEVVCGDRASEWAQPCVYLVVDGCFAGTDQDLDLTPDEVWALIRALVSAYLWSVAVEDRVREVGEELRGELSALKRARRRVRGEEPADADLSVPLGSAFKALASELESVELWWEPRREAAAKGAAGSGADADPDLPTPAERLVQLAARRLAVADALLKACAEAKARALASVECAREYESQ